MEGRMTDRREAQRVLRAQCGDREALEALLRAVQSSLFHYISGLVGFQGAEDVLQDVFVQICRHLKQLRDPYLFRPWAYRIASRASFLSLKRERRWQPSDDDAAIEDLPAGADRNAPALLSDLSVLLDSVSLASRAVLLLHYVQGLSLEETAAVLGVSIGTVKSRLAWGLSRLRKRMEVKR
jgi:RNA polymerase sigma-70 factor (ECF subfamily)